MSTDLIIIGAGPGGYETAVKAAKSGLQVTVIEKSQLGGTCLNAGCIPTKCLCHSAELLENARELGLDAPGLDYLAKAVERKDEVVEKLRAGVAMLMKTPGITLVEGEAHFVDAHTVEVAGTQYAAQNIIIATGSVTKFLPIEGAHAEGVLTSTEILDLKSLPRPEGLHLCIIGGGVIGLEFASVYRSFGAEVDVVEFCKEIIPAFDKDIAKRLRTSLKKRGINFHVGAAAKAIAPGSPMKVSFVEKDKEQSLECDLVLMAVGRAANVGAINFDDIQVEYTPRGIKVDANMQTNVPGVYAIGDVNGLCQLAHAATFQGYKALAHILGKEENYDLSIIPAAVFTTPEAAMVGATEETLTSQGVEYTVHKAFYRANGKALSMNADDGIAKILVAPDGKILGAHILGAHASDLIHEVTVLMQTGGTLEDIARTVHAHPSLSEIILAAAEA